MANAKVTDLSAITTINGSDVLPIVDVSESATKKITMSQIAGNINLPYLQQVDLTDQSIANTALAQVITFNTDVYHSLITRTTSSKFTVTEAGLYLISFSAVVSCADAVAGKTIQIWMRVNGVDVPASNTVYNFKGTTLNAVVTVNFLQVFTAGQYFELWMAGDDTQVQLNYTAAGAAPVTPACPSIILTANRMTN